MLNYYWNCAVYTQAGFTGIVRHCALLAVVRQACITQFCNSAVKAELQSKNIPESNMFRFLY